MADRLIVKRAVDIAVDGILIHRSEQAALRILEAGCGSLQHASIAAPKFVTGIDIDPDQLAHNELLDEKILGDLESYPLPPESFDLVICVDVIEHLKNPRSALESMLRATAKGGYLIIAAPEPWSYKGFVAKYTPHSWRAGIFRILTGRTSTLGKGVHKAFFPTYLREICNLRRLEKWAVRNGLQVSFTHSYDAHSAGISRKLRLIVHCATGINSVVTSLSGGKVNLLHADYVLALQRPR